MEKAELLTNEQHDVLIKTISTLPEYLNLINEFSSGSKSVDEMRQEIVKFLTINIIKFIYAYNEQKLSFEEFSPIYFRKN